MRQTHRGFTVIELLVVIAIIAVLIAAAPAGSAGGELATDQCTNSLKQLGLSLANYESSNATFPIGTVHGNFNISGMPGAFAPAPASATTARIRPGLPWCFPTWSKAASITRSTRRSALRGRILPVTSPTAPY